MDKGKSTNRFTVLLTDEQQAWVEEQGGAMKKGAYVKKLIDEDIKRSKARNKRIKRNAVK